MVRLAAARFEFFVFQCPGLKRWVLRWSWIADWYNREHKRYSRPWVTFEDDLLEVI